MNNDYNNEPDVKRLINELSNLRHQSWRSVTHIWTLKRLSLELSSYLPRVSDSTLFEIDDLIYEGVNTTVVAGTRIPSEETVKLLTEECYGIYHEFFFVKKQEIGREAEMVFFQLLELVSDDIYEKVFFDPNLCTTLDHPTHSIECNLKALKLAMNSHKKVFQHHIDELFDKVDFYVFISLPLVLSWTDESDYEHPIKKRWALWISEQSASILEKLPLEKYHHHSDVIDYIRKCKHRKEIIYGWEYVSIVSLCYNYLTAGVKSSLFGDDDSLFIHHLFKFFMSTQDNNQKIQRIYDYIQGLHLITRFGEYEITKSDINKNLEAIQDFTYSEIFVNSICDIRIKLRHYPMLMQERLMKVVKRYGYYMGSSSYLPKESLPSSYTTFKEKTNELMDKYFGNFDNFEVDETSGDEIEELSCFRDFIKGVQVMDIMHIAWLMLKDTIPSEYLHSCPYYESARLEVFMNNCNFFKYLLIEFNKDPENNEICNMITFADQVLLRTCPFLVLSHYHDISHMEKLIKRLSGRNIGKANEEAIHFMLTQRYIQKP